MKKKIPAFEIALSAVACALATIFLSLGVLNNFLLATGYIVACFAMMLPLSKGFIVGDVIAYVATVLLTFLFGGVAVPWRVVPFILFFGLHPLVNYLQIRFKWNKIIAFVVKAVWFCGSMYLVWRFVFDMTTNYDWLDEWMSKYAIPTVLVVGTLFFAVYDRLLFRCQKVMDGLISRIKKE